jgi:hypothetical protein
MGQPAAGSEPNRHVSHEPVRESQNDTDGRRYRAPAQRRLLISER